MTHSFEKAKPSINRVYKKSTKQKSIYILEKLNIGGVGQWILIRGKDALKPVLLFLHGGPGTAQICFAPSFQAELEQHFIVVNWDQRGAGKSYSPDIPKESMNINRLVSDTLELAEILAARFGQEKIYLAGHSWGSVLGLYSIQQKPGLFEAYVGLGQVVNIKETGRLLYNYTMSEAQRKNDKKSLQLLQSIGYPPTGNSAKAAIAQIKLLDKYGGVYAKSNIRKMIFRSAIRSHDYTLQEKLQYFAASSFCFYSLFDELSAVNMLDKVKTVQVPVYFFVGRHDYNTPFELTEQYFNRLQAPVKKLVWFENSGHAPQFEEPGRFTQEMVNVVLEQDSSESAASGEQ